MFFISLLIAANLFFVNPQPAAELHQPAQTPVATFTLPVSQPVCIQACNEPTVQATADSAFILQ